MPLQDHEIPTIVIVGPLDSHEADIASNVVYSTTDSGTTSIFMDYSKYNADFTDTDNTEVEVTTLDTEVSYTSIIDTLEVADLKDKALDIVSTAFLAKKNSFAYDIDTEWYLSPYISTVSNDTYMDFRINLGVIPIRDDINVDMFFSNVTYYSCTADLYCCLTDTPRIIDIDVKQGDGRITRLSTDIYTATFDTSYLNASVYSTAMGMAPSGSNKHCCSYSGISCSGTDYPGATFCSTTYSGLLALCSTYSGCVYEALDYCIRTCSGTSYYGSVQNDLGYCINTYSGTTYSGATYSGCTYDYLDYRVDTYPRGILSDLEVSTGGITLINLDIYSTSLGLSAPTSVDFKTRSLFTGDFFVERDQFVTASSIAWVDVIDYLYPINTDNTFFYVEGVLASGVYFEDIPNGKRMYYNPLNDFYSDGVLNYSIHVENSMGEVEEKDFYFLYGYDLQLDEVVDWGPNKQVLVRAEAGNLVFCPGLAGAAFEFGTVDLTSFNLGCSITPVGFEDLTFKIVPQSTVFFYGKTYTVRLHNVKDFAGNTMPDLEYEFTIEDPN